jgi:ankyrin repeat protein
LAEIAQEILCWEPTGPTLLTRVDSSGRTPLHFAVLYKRLDVVKLFLEDQYASFGLVSICDENGSSPMHIAAMLGETRTVDELVKRCPDYYEMVDDKGRNLLHFAVQHGQEKMVTRICQDKKFAMLLNATDYEGNTSLHLAVNFAYPRIASILLATRDVDMGITNRAGLTAADLARRARPIGLRRYFLVNDLALLRILSLLYLFSGSYYYDLLNHGTKCPAEPNCNF